MTYTAFLLSAIAVSLSGVMAPGPITAVTLGKGSRQAHAGAMIALGHGLFEFPLMLAIWCGISFLQRSPAWRVGVGLVGGILLVLMGAGMLRLLGGRGGEGARDEGRGARGERQSLGANSAAGVLTGGVFPAAPASGGTGGTLECGGNDAALDSAGAYRAGSSALLAGLALTAANPYFLLWWGSVGTKMIADAVLFGFLGFAVFAVAHWMCDLVWLWLLSAMAYRGGQSFGPRFQRVTYAVCGVFLLIMGGKFIVDAVGQLRT